MTNSECWWGDHPVNPQGANSGDCSQPCAGDPREICGNGNRMLMYRDTTWVIPTRPDLGNQVQEYLDLLIDLQQKIQAWYDLLQQALAQQNSAKARRQGVNADLLLQIANARAAILSLQSRLQQLTATITRHFKTGDNYRLLEEIELQDLAQVYPPVNDQVLAIATDAAIVANSGLNAVAILAQRAVVTFGKPRVIRNGIIITAATGVFKLGYDLLDSLLGGEEGSPTPSVSVPQSQPATQPPTTTPSPTSTRATSSSSSSTCTYTETPTPVIVVTKKGTTTFQFQELVQSLPVDKNSETMTDSYLPNWVYIGEMDRCAAEKLWDNPIVEAMTLNRPVAIFESNDVDPSTIDINAPVTKRSVVTKRDFNNNADSTSQRQPSANNSSEPSVLSERTLAADKQYVQQVGSGYGLRFLAGQSHQKANSGQFYDFEEYLYDDRSLKASTVFPPRIYIMDTAFLQTHQDIAGRVKSFIDVSDIPIGTIDSNHGTCMASIAAGSFAGVYKDADIVLVQARFTARDNAIALDKIIKAFGAVMYDVTSLGLGGRAVLSMSFGESFNFFPLKYSVPHLTH